MRKNERKNKFYEWICKLISYDVYTCDALNKLVFSMKIKQLLSTTTKNHWITFEIVG